VPLPAIADAVGTPVYVYSQATLERHARVFVDALKPLPRVRVAFAVKANPNVGVLRVLARMGLGADVVSGGELDRALAAGMAPADIVFSGVGKTAGEMVRGLASGIGQFNIESEEEGRELSAIAASSGLRAAATLRINPDVDARTHAKISTGGEDNKFGIPFARVPAAFARAAGHAWLRPVGVAAHIGSQLFDLSPLEEAFGRLGGLVAELRAAGHAVTRVDLGGGLGVPHRAGAPPPPTPAEYAAMVARATAGWDARLIFEPGRMIAGNAGVMIARVILVKAGAEKTFVVLDAGMNDLIRPSLYDAWHDIVAVAPTGRRMIATVVGPVCESGDSFAADRDIDAAAAGDLVAVRTAGAYGATMASTYNSRALVPEVMVAGGDWAVVSARRTPAEMMALDTVAPWLRPASPRVHSREPAYQETE
jgi:diaminopimelate decarboxylase